MFGGWYGYICVILKPNLYYVDIIYDKPLNESFKMKIEKIHYNVALIIIVAFKGNSRGKIYEELGLQSLADWRWTRKLFFPQNNRRITTILPQGLSNSMW